jgi:hypothetical protein
MDVFVVERFLVDWSAAEIDDLIGRCERGGGAFERLGVRHIESILLPDDETCLSVYTGPDADSVLEANLDVGLPTGRVVAGVAHGAGASR